MTEIAKKIESLLGDFSSLEHRIRHLEYDTEVCSERIEVRCSYVSFRDGEITFNEFMDAVSNTIIPFCLPRQQILQATEKMKSTNDHVTISRTMSELHEKARGLFIKAKKGSHRSGEAGEIVLYILNEWVLKAPQIVSKMYLKTNNNMPVHGTDGIHAKFDQNLNKLIVYWGESKCHKTISSGLKDALASIKEFIDSGHEKREIEIVSDHLDLGKQGAEAQEAILQYLDPYTKQSNERITVFSCLLVFDAPKLKPATKGTDGIEAAFIKDVNKAVESFIGSIKKSTDETGLGSKRFEFFLVPVPSVQAFRDEFQTRIGWPDD